MKTRGLPRRVGASLAVIAIAFTQLAVSAYACPNMGAQPAMQMADGADCPEMQSAPTNLCHQACAQPPQFHQTADIPVLPPAMDTGLRVQDAIAKVLPQSVSIEAPIERATSPPLAIALVRFLK